MTDLTPQERIGPANPREDRWRDAVRVERRRAEAAEAERDRLKGELENEYGRAEAFKHSLKVRTAERDRLEGLRLAARSDAEGWKSLHEESSAERDRLAGRVAELERERYSGVILNEREVLRSRLQRATEALREEQQARERLAARLNELERDGLYVRGREDERRVQAARSGLDELGPR